MSLTVLEIFHISLTAMLKYHFGSTRFIAATLKLFDFLIFRQAIFHALTSSPSAISFRIFFRVLRIYRLSFKVLKFTSHRFLRGILSFIPSFESIGLYAGFPTTNSWIAGSLLNKDPFTILLCGLGASKPTITRVTIVGWFWL